MPPLSGVPAYQGCGVGDARSQRFLGGVGVGFLTTLGVGFFVPLRLRKSQGRNQERANRAIATPEIFANMMPFAYFT